MSTTLNLPTVTLDTTLADLYKRASPKNAHKRIAQVMCPVNSAIQLSQHIPRNVKYLYQDGAFNEPSNEVGTYNMSAQSKREWAIMYITLVTQRDAFLSGATTVVLFYMGESDAQQIHDKSEVRKTLSVLPDKQRPKVIFCLGPAEVPVKEEKIDLVVYKLASDSLEGYDLLTPLETHWYINTKEALAKSGLPTPRCNIVEVDGYARDVTACCSICRRAPNSFLIPVTCTGSRGRWYSEQSSKVYSAITARSLPFVFKNQQSFGGAGTYLIRTEADREKLLWDLQKGVLRRQLSYLSPVNHHLGPATIILSELIEDAVGNYGLSFFVTDDESDEPIFLAVTEQILLEGRYWIGSSIRYDHQAELKTKFGKLVRDMSTWYRSYGYVGPVGVDVLETTGSEEHLPNFHVLDLNARTSGQLCLPLLRTHFTKRGLNYAASFFIRISKRRDEFITMFEGDFKAGKFCILSWYDDSEYDISFANVVVGAEDLNNLNESMQRIRSISEEVKY